jgi:hypothetical protein
MLGVVLRAYRYWIILVLEEVGRFAVSQYVLQGLCRGRHLCSGISARLWTLNEGYASPYSRQ